MSKNLKYYLIYLLVAILAYWQIAFFQNMLKWDMIDAYLPWRSFISESIINGHFPFWNPYQDFGYPIHADMRSIWVPEVWLMSLFGGYSVYSLAILFILYTSIAGIGMKFLANYFVKDEKAAFFVGLTYMLSGYLTAHGQEMSTINSFTFIPVVIFQYLKFKDNINFKSALSFFVFTFITILSGYQAHSFILLYLLLTLFIYIIVDLYKKSELVKIKTFVLYHIGFVLTMLVLALPIIISAYQVFPFVQRLNSGVSTDTLSILSFSPQSLLSLILPFSVIRNIDFFNTDLSMTNLYFGIITLVFFVVSLFHFNRKSIFTVILVFGLLSLLASFGNYTPFRALLFDYVPFMNLFRGSAFFRLFALIPFVISAGFVFTQFNTYKKSIIYVTTVIIALLLGFLAFSISEINWESFSFLYSKDAFFDILSKTSTYYENIFVQSLIQILILGSFLILIFLRKANYKTLIILITLDLIFAVQLNIRSTSISKFSPKNTDLFLSSQPIGFPVPSELNVSKCSDASVSNTPLWRNTNIFAKRVSGDSFNSFYFDKTQVFRDSLFILRDSVTNNNLVYFSSDIQPLSKINNYPFTRKTVFVTDTIANRLHFVNQNKNKATIEQFFPNQIVINLDVKKQGLLTLIQSYYPGWKAYVDGEEVEIIESNTMFMSVVVKNGKHQLIFQYSNKIILYSFIVSSILFLALIFLLLYFQYKSFDFEYKFIVFIMFLTILISFSSYKLYIYHSQQSSFESALISIIEEQDNNNFIIYDGDVVLNTSKQIEIDLSKPSNFTNFKKLVEKENAKTLILIWKNKKINQIYLSYLRNVYSNENTIVEIGTSKIIEYSEKIKLDEFAYNTFEDIKGNWNFDKFRLIQDSLTDNNVLNYKDREYACSYSLFVNEKTVINSVFIMLDVIAEEKVNPALVISIEKEGESLYWKSLDFSKFQDLDKKVNTFAFNSNFNKQELIPGSELKIYIWNKNKEDFNIDNFKILVNK